MRRKTITRRGHPLANKNSLLRLARFVLFEKLKGVAGKCNWCDTPLTWKTLCADHLDGKIDNDKEENLVASCRGCNANRDDGTGNGRKKPKICPQCEKEFISRYHHKKTVYCSITCASKNRPKRGTKAKHGTRSRYMVGCRCRPCVTSNSSYWFAWSKGFVGRKN